MGTPGAPSHRTQDEMPLSGERVLPRAAASAVLSLTEKPGFSEWAGLRKRPGPRSSRRVPQDRTPRLCVWRSSFPHEPDEKSLPHGFMRKPLTCAPTATLQVGNRLPGPLPVPGHRGGDAWGQCSCRRGGMERNALQQRQPRSAPFPPGTLSGR